MFIELCERSCAWNRKDIAYVPDKRYSEACKLASSKKIIRNLFNPLIKTRFISLKRLRSASQMEHALNSLMKFTKTEEKLKKTDEIRGVQEKYLGV